MNLLSLLVSLPAESIAELLTGHYLSPHNLAGTSEQQASHEVNTYYLHLFISFMLKSNRIAFMDIEFDDICFI